MADVAHPPAWAVFTDGSCHTKDRIGGWAFVAYSEKDDRHSESGSAIGTTNNRMELTAPIEFLEWLHEHQGPSRVLVFSDSMYVVGCASNPHWNRRFNSDLWERLDAAVEAHNEVVFEHVRGHANSYYNELADQLAGTARKAKRDEGRRISSGT